MLRVYGNIIFSKENKDCFEIRFVQDEYRELCMRIINPFIGFGSIKIVNLLKIIM